MATKKLNTEIFYTILVVSIAVFWGMGFVFIPWAQQSNAPSSLICLFRFGVSAILIAAIFNRKIKIRKENILMSRRGASMWEQRVRYTGSWMNSCGMEIQ